MFSTQGPTVVGGPVADTTAPAAVEDDESEGTSTNGTGQLVPLLTKNRAATGAIALIAGLSAAAAAFV